MIYRSDSDCGLATPPLPPTPAYPLRPLPPRVLPSTEPGAGITVAGYLCFTSSVINMLANFHHGLTPPPFPKHFPLLIEKQNLKIFHELDLLCYFFVISLWFNFNCHPLTEYSTCKYNMADVGRVALSVMVNHNVE